MNLILTSPERAELIKLLTSHRGTSTWLATALAKIEALQPPELAASGLQIPVTPQLTEQMNALETHALRTGQVIEQVTGISEEDSKAIFAAVKENQARLDGCAEPHDFSICLDRRTKQAVENPTPQQLFGCYWRCTKCGGDVEGSAKRWYVRGMEAAKVV